MIRLNKVLLCTIMLILGGMLQACGNKPPAVTLVPTVAATPVIEAVLQPPEGKFFFVEFWVDYEGLFVLIDGPLYSFDPVTPILITHFQEDQFPPGNWGIIGQGMSMGNATNALTIASSLPYENHINIFTGHMGRSLRDMKEIPVNMLAISADGTLELEIDGQPFLLGVGEKWEQSVEIEEDVDGQPQRYRIASSITNYGWLDRSHIQFRP